MRPNYVVTWINESSFMILTRPTDKLELGSPLEKHGGRVQLVREVVPGRQGVTLGCQINDVQGDYWTWTTLSIAMVDVFGFQIMNPLDHVLKACPTDFMEDLYKDHHGKELA